MQLPDFLQGVKLSIKEKERLEPIMANWLTAHEHVRTLQADEAGLYELKLMIVYEITERKRLHMLQRLRARFNNLRMLHENAQLFMLSSTGEQK